MRHGFPMPASIRRSLSARWAILLAIAAPQPRGHHDCRRSWDESGLRRQGMPATASDKEDSRPSGRFQRAAAVPMTTCRNIERRQLAGIASSEPVLKADIRGGSGCAGDQNGQGTAIPSVVLTRLFLAGQRFFSRRHVQSIQLQPCARRAGVAACPRLWTD